jgi:CYTH domain-containing protein
MSAADHTGDRDTWHRVRLAAKPLRALVAPFDGVATELDVLFAALTALQDAIGAARDLHLLRRLARTTAPDARALRVALTARRDALDDAVQTLAADHDRLRDALSAAVRWLDGRRPADLEIERKFLLRALPEAATAAPSVRITQGWLPGERLRERLRRSVFPDGRVEWTRTVKLGTGVTRVEVEEAASPMLFESLWPLTAAARVAKVRYTVATDHATWEIDDFLDRPLVLAEIELPREDAPVTFPEWLAPYVEREVTGEAAYVNANLARATRVPGSA